MAKGLPANKTVIIHFSRPSYLDIASWFVRIIERRKYSHACIELVDPATGTPLIFQVNGRGANFMYKPTFLAHNTVIESYEIRTSTVGYHGTWAYALLSMGSDYSYTALLNIGLKKLFRVKSWFKDGDKTTICSELAARVCALSGLPMPSDVENLSPSDLNTFISDAVAKSYAVKRIL